MHRSKYHREEALIRSFILPKRRKRLMLLMRSPKGRSLFLESLAESPDIDPRFARHIPERYQNPDGILTLLQRRHANHEGYLISADPELDGREVDLVQGIELAMASDAGTMLSCVEGRLAYYKGQESGAHFLLERAEPRMNTYSESG